MRSLAKIKPTGISNNWKSSRCRVLWRCVVSCSSVLIYSFKLITIDDELITEKTSSTRAAWLLMCYFFLHKGYMLFIPRWLCCSSSFVRTERVSPWDHNQRGIRKNAQRDVAPFEMFFRVFLIDCRLLLWVCNAIGLNGYRVGKWLVCFSFFSVLW